MDEAAALDRLAALKIETPSWGYGNSGTRFHVFPWPGAARNAFERLDDAALVHRLTGCCPSVALHIPWDRVDDWAALAAHAGERGVRIGAINPNLFGEDEYRLGSFCHPDASVRAKALDHCRECVEIAQALGSDTISLWLADGTNYPGQDDLASRYARLTGGLEELYALLPPGMKLLVEYKFFEPAFYSTDLPDWGTSALVCRRLGPRPGADGIAVSASLDYDGRGHYRGPQFARDGSANTWRRMAARLSRPQRAAGRELLPSRLRCGWRDVRRARRRSSIRASAMSLWKAGLYMSEPRFCYVGDGRLLPVVGEVTEPEPASPGRCGRERWRRTRRGG